MDACTADMCERAWGRPSFAKVLIDVWAIGHLKREIEVFIPNLSGGKNESVKVQVEYIWEPVQCEKCKIFGHKISSCIKAALEKRPKDKKKVDDEGFTLVERKVWKPKVVEHATNGVVKDFGQCSNSGKENSVVLNKEVIVEPQVVREEEPLVRGSGKDTNDSRLMNNEDPIVNKPNQPVVKPKVDSKKESGSGSGTRGDSLTQSVVSSFKSTSKPIKGILKNPTVTNRFSALNNRDGGNDGSPSGDMHVVGSNVAPKSDGKKESGSNKGGTGPVAKHQ